MADETEIPFVFAQVVCNLLLLTPEPPAEDSIVLECPDSLETILVCGLDAVNESDRIYVAGHTGLAGSAICRRLATAGYCNVLTRTHPELDLTVQLSVGASTSGVQFDGHLKISSSIWGSTKVAKHADLPAHDRRVGP